MSDFSAGFVAASTCGVPVLLIAFDSPLDQPEPYSMRTSTGTFQGCIGYSVASQNKSLAHESADARLHGQVRDLSQRACENANKQTVL